MAGMEIEDRCRKHTTASFSTMQLDLQGVCVRFRFYQTSADPNDTKKTPICIFKLLGRATAEGLVDFIMYITIKHFQKWSLILSGSEMNIRSSKLKILDRSEKMAQG